MDTISDMKGKRTSDVIARYAEMVAEIRNFPYALIKHRGVLDFIFSTSDVKLVAENGDFIFTNKDFAISNFGAVVLEVQTSFDVEDIQHYVQLLVISHHDNPHFARLNSLELSSSRWIERLGVMPRRQKNTFITGGR